MLLDLLMNTSSILKPSAMKDRVGKFLAIAPANYGLYISDNAEGWNYKSASLPAGVTDMIFAGGKYIANCSGQLYYSYDTMYWYVCNQPYNFDKKKLKYLNGKYFAYGRTNGTGNVCPIVTSTDGINWTSAGTVGNLISSNSSHTVEINDIIYCNDMYAVLGYVNNTYNSSYYLYKSAKKSFSGFSWISLIDSLDKGLNKITYSDTNFYIVGGGNIAGGGYNNRIYKSDSLELNSATLDYSGSEANKIFTDACDFNTNSIILTSSDNNVWYYNKISKAFTWATNGRNIEFGNGVQILTYNNNNYYKKFNGSIWETIEGPSGVTKIVFSPTS